MVKPIPVLARLSVAVPLDPITPGNVLKPMSAEWSAIFVPIKAQGGAA